MQGGMNAVRMPDGSLARATGSAGNDVYRGDRLPKDMVGDYFYGEVVARIVRRLRPVKTEGLTQLKNVYPFSEFIRSTDPLFRPVDMTTAPDGTMYITDMYRGIIQESQWSGPGTYLRQRIDQYGLDKIVKQGPDLAADLRRAWGGAPSSRRCSRETPAQLVAHLSDANGWWRDTAQQLLVLKQDKSVVPALQKLARSSTDQLARIHALWTLDGLGAADAALVAAADGGQGRADSHPGHSRQRDALQGRRQDARGRLQEAQHRRRRRRRDAVADDDEHLEGAGRGRDAQAGAGGEQGQGRAARRHRDPQPPATGGRGGGIFMEAAAPFTPDEQAVVDKGREIYTQVCFACHGDDGNGGRVPGSGTRR